MTFAAILDRLLGAPAAPTPGDPAETPEWLPDPPSDLGPRPDPHMPYGYLLGEQLHACARGELVEKLAQAPGLSAVWTPETGALVRPEEVPALLPEVRARSRKAMRKEAVVLGMTTLGFGAAGVLLWRVGWRAFLPLLAVLGAMAVIGFAASLVQLRSREEIGADTFAQARPHVRHAAWVQARPAPWSWWLAGCVVAVAVVGIAPARESAVVAVAGLLKDRVWAEPFRLLTAPMLHVHFFHAWMNVPALLWLSRLTEAHAPRGHLPLVFLLSALAGSVASALLLAAPSVGASGGILGLVGYLLARSRRRSGSFPEGFHRRLEVAIILTAVIGAVGIAFIDNAAHAGGLGAGTLLGRALVPAGGDRPEPAWLRAAGWAALAVLTAAALLAIGLILFDPLGSAGALDGP
ncbi:MAG TPA: rhomboid family intramembrane serine protease [Longimicrobium sp.]|nr:rhomboid family intramembrane serine protease [Longimicrobium sp.]